MKNKTIDEMSTSVEIDKDRVSLCSVPFSAAVPFDRKRVGRYEIIYPIAQGGMAVVYAGRLTGIAGFQRLVAIKVIHPQLATDERFVKMFLDEARISAGIHHPNVGEVFEVGEDDGLYYMVGELIIGQSLGALQIRALRENITISSALYARIASVTAQALQAAHDLKGPDGTPLRLVHRDVSPRNILLTYDGFVKLIDFGVAYAHNRLASTEVGTVKGKLGFMSPEQLKSHPIDGRSDIFSLGVVLYQNLTNQSPFHADTEIERIDKILNHRFTPPRQIDPGISPALEAIVLRAMAFLPADRYATAADMSKDLEVFINSAKFAVDTLALSGTMLSLFQEERAYHFGKIREIGNSEVHLGAVDETETTRNIRRERPPAAAVQPCPVAPERNAPPLSVPADADPPSRRRTSIAEWVAVGVACVLLSVAVFGVIRRQMDSPTVVQTEQVVTSPKKEAPAPMHEPPIPVSDAPPGNSAVLRPSRIALTLDIYPPVANMTLDTELIDLNRNPLHLDADGKVHQIRVFAEDYIDQETALTADRDQTLSIRLMPRPLRTEAAKTKKTSRKKESLQPVAPATPDVEFIPPESSPSTTNTLLEKSPYR